jgi:hypothetical protein
VGAVAKAKMITAKAQTVGCRRWISRMLRWLATLSTLGSSDGLVRPADTGLAAVDQPGGDFCLNALDEALARHSRPENFQSIHEHGGRGSWRDNVFIERLWHTLKYEVYLRAYEWRRHVVRSAPICPLQMR